MIIPFATPQDGELLNLAQIVRVRQVCINQAGRENEIEVYLANGEKRVYTGTAADNINTETIFALQTYRDFQLSAVAARDARNNLIVPPTMNGLPN